MSIKRMQNATTTATNKNTERSEHEISQLQMIDSVRAWWDTSQRGRGSERRPLGTRMFSIIPSLASACWHVGMYVWVVYVIFIASEHKLNFRFFFLLPQFLYLSSEQCRRIRITMGFFFFVARNETTENIYSIMAAFSIYSQCDASVSARARAHDACVSSDIGLQWKT